MEPVKKLAAGLTTFGQIQWNHSPQPVTVVPLSAELAHSDMTKREYFLPRLSKVHHIAIRNRTAKTEGETGYSTSPIKGQRKTEELALCLLAERRHEALPLQLPHRIPADILLRHRLPLALPRELLGRTGEATRREEGRIRVRVERASERRPDVDHALHEGQVLVIAVRQARRQGAEDVEELSRMAPATC